MRAAALLILPFALLLTASMAPLPAAGARTIRASPVRLDDERPEHRRVGALEYLGGWELTSNDPRFGGISSMMRERDGIVALSDAGQIIRFSLPDARGRIARLSITPLPGLPRAGALKQGIDSESLTADPATGRIWVGFEGDNAIRRYARAFGRLEGAVRPEAMKRWPVNGGPESLARLEDGRFLVLSEERPAPGGGVQGLLFAGDPLSGGAPVRFGYKPPDGYAPTDAAQLADGRLLVLNRRFRLWDGVSAVLTRLDPAGIRSGATLVGEEIARLKPPLTVDNMEALAVERHGDRDILWLGSDDNFSALQRTLLLKFALRDRR